MRQPFFPLYPAEKSETELFNVSDPFSDYQRSKSKEHNDRFTANENFQKTEKNEDITS